MPSVIIVDDQQPLCELIQEVLSDSEFDVVGVAYDGAEAVRLAGQLLPDVVVMDVDLPEMSGFETTPHILAESPLSMVVLTSALDDRVYLQQAKAAGAMDFVAKGCLTASRLRLSLGLPDLPR